MPLAPFIGPVKSPYAAFLRNRSMPFAGRTSRDWRQVSRDELLATPLAIDWMFPATSNSASGSSELPPYAAEDIAEISSDVWCKEELLESYTRLVWCAGMALVGGVRVAGGGPVNSEWRHNWVVTPGPLDAAFARALTCLTELKLEYEYECDGPFEYSKLYHVHLSERLQQVHKDYRQELPRGWPVSAPQVQP